MADPTFRCDRGAERDSIEVTTATDERPSYVPGPLLEPCTCPTCAHCDIVLHEGQCANMDCPLYSVLVPQEPE